MTYIRTYGGWLYLAVVPDLFSCQGVGWPMSSWIDIGLAIKTPLMAVLRCKPADPVTVHSDLRSQFANNNWHDFLAEHRLEPSMS
ncbi:DDE-type integrase/transposase/recombinase [Massilia sp. erpn]|nr:DDE-type integrase/transposase/recombinase [Massilia sp. erpn]